MLQRVCMLAPSNTKTILQKSDIQLLTIKKGEYGVKMKAENYQKCKYNLTWSFKYVFRSTKSWIEYRTCVNSSKHEI